MQHSWSGARYVAERDTLDREEEEEWMAGMEEGEVVGWLVEGEPPVDGGPPPGGG